MENKTQIKRTFTVSLVDSNVKFRNNLRQLAQAVTDMEGIPSCSSQSKRLHRERDPLDTGNRH